MSGKSPAIQATLNSETGWSSVGNCTAAITKAAPVKSVLADATPVTMRAEPAKLHAVGNTAAITKAEPAGSALEGVTALRSDAGTSEINTLVRL
jgi:hypothetical protein